MTYMTMWTAMVPPSMNTTLYRLYPLLLYRLWITHGWHDWV